MKFGKLRDLHASGCVQNSHRLVVRRQESPAVRRVAGALQLTQMGDNETRAAGESIPGPQRSIGGARQDLLPVGGIERGPNHLRVAGKSSQLSAAARVP